MFLIKDGTKLIICFVMLPHVRGILAVLVSQSVDLVSVSFDPVEFFCLLLT